MTSDVLPQFRADVSVNVEEKDNESYLVLHDVFGIAEGPVMVHADMLSVLERCDGHTTWQDIANDAGVELDSKELMQTRAFVNQLDELGYFETRFAAERQQQMLHEWNGLTERPAVCSGSTYPADPDELRVVLDTHMQHTNPEVGDSNMRCVLIPHIDYRVAPDVYGPAFNAIKDNLPDLVVMIGTSHYWSEHRIILTKKHQQTPLGTVQTNTELVEQLSKRLTEFNGEHNLLAPTDLAFRPEHSLELHAVFLRHIYGERPFTTLPILVTGFGGEDDPSGLETMENIGATVRELLRDVGAINNCICLISGDLAHIGARFGDEVTAEELLPATRQADRGLLRSLVEANISQYHQQIEDSEHRFRICGHAATVLALNVFEAEQGIELAYGEWNDAPTQSAVTFASVGFVLAHIDEMP